MLAGLLGASACGDDPSTPTAPTTTTPPPPTTTTPPPPATATLTDLSLFAPSWFVDDPEIDVGETVELTLEAEYSDGSTEDVTDDAMWSSSNADVATVVDGVITGQSPGTAQAIAEYSGRRVSAEFRVRQAVAEYEFDPQPPSAIHTGDTGHFRVNITRGGPGERLLTGVTSSAPSVLRLDLEGDRYRYTGVSPGAAEIRVVHEGARKLTHQVRVEARPEPWSRSGTGDDVFDYPSRITRVRITGSYDGRGQNFIVRCGNDLLVNVIIGTGRDSTRYTGTHSLSRCHGPFEITGSNGVRWTITETAPRN